MNKNSKKLMADNLPDVESIKKMVRLLELIRQAFIGKDWKEHKGVMERNQFNQLMSIRFLLPCNLRKIMSVTGLTSAGASLFVDKLVQKGILKRMENPDDRRNILISLTQEGQTYLKEVDERLNLYTIHYLRTCTGDELRFIGAAADIICKRLEECPGCPQIHSDKEMQK